MYRMILSTKNGVLRYGIQGDGVRVEDVTNDPARLNLLIQRCNEGDLDPQQLHDVVEDWIVEELTPV